ncbi:hypothetical protein PG996_005409 [Apiospora saccharicola]|uniref:DUF7053 domain-containing protein n=1 Tax=Apiospora saccharicola TaxID=335842 RepID=A0ABR1VLE6_9PEZI
MLSSITLTHTCKLPRNVTRQAVIEFLHSHEDIIDLSPLVKERHPIKAPASPPPHMQQLDHASWWSITDRISYLPGHLLNGQYTYKGAFLNKSTGLEAYIDAPAGTTLKDVWSVVESPSCSPSSPSSSSQRTRPTTTSSQPGEETGCLYIRVDSSANCHFALRAFVRKMLKRSHRELVRRLAAKTQLNASAFGWSDSTSMSMSNDDFESVILRSKPSREWGGGRVGIGGGHETPSPTETISPPASFFTPVTVAPAATTTPTQTAPPPAMNYYEMADLYSFATHTGPFTAAEQAQAWTVPDTTQNMQTGYNAWSAGRFWESDYRAHVGLNVGRGQTV